MKCIECGAEDNIEIELPGLMEALAMTYRCAECSERYQAQLRRENDAAIVELQTKYGSKACDEEMLEEMLEAYGDKDI